MVLPKLSGIEANKRHAQRYYRLGDCLNKHNTVLKVGGRADNVIKHASPQPKIEDEAVKTQLV
jgi:hypothetical protein